MEPKLVIMAAGLGSRYGGLKQMDSVGINGEWIMDYSIYDALQSGFKSIVFIINEVIEVEFKERMNNKYGHVVHLEYCVQSIEDIPGDVPIGRIKPWGTAHAIYSARHILKGPFAVINADDFYGREAYCKVYDFLKEGKENFALIGYALENTLSEHGSVARGLCTLRKEQLVSIEERVDIQRYDNRIVSKHKDQIIELKGDMVVSMNMWGFTPLLIERIEKDFKTFLKHAYDANPLKAEYYLPEVVDTMIQGGDIHVQVIETSEKWFGVTFAEDKGQVKASIERIQEQYPKSLWEK